MRLSHFIGTLCLLCQSAIAGTLPDVRVLNTTNGLSDNFVNSICQDEDGNIWMATELGVNRYNGTSFRAFYKGETQGNEICGVQCYGSNVYVASRRNGLSIFDMTTETFSSMTKENHRISANDITDVSVTPDGGVWVSYYWDGLDYITKSALGERLIHYEASTLPGLGSDHIWTIADDGHGILYVGHVDAGLSVVNTGNMRVENYRHSDSDPSSLPADDVYALMADKRGGVWVGTNHGLSYFIDGHFVPVRSVTGHVRSIQQMDDDVIWVGLENGGVQVISNVHGIFSSQKNLEVENLHIHGLDNITVQDICKDSFGNAWIATFGSGVTFVSQRHYFASQWNTSDNDLCWRVAWGLASDSQGRIWVGTDGGGIDIFDGAKIVEHFDSENTALTDNAILASLCDSDGNMWFGTFERGLFFCDTKTKKFSRVDLNARAVDVRCLTEKDGSILVGCNDGLFCIDKRTRQVVKHINKSNSVLRDDLVRAISYDATGNLWVGTYGQGLAVLNPDGQEIAIFSDSSFIANTINHIYRDRQDRFWVATGNGLAVIDGNNPTQYRSVAVAGLVSFAIAEGRNGQIWVSTNVGVSCVDVANDRIYNFDQRDGVPRGLYKAGSVTRGLDGTLYFGSEEGVAIVDTDLSRWPSVAPCANITGFHYCSDKMTTEDMLSLPVGQPIELDYNNNIFSVEFGVKDVSFADMVEFSFKMEGIDTEWNHAGKSRETAFRNVSPGNYVFKVRTRMRGGEWMTEYASLAIRVLPPLWLTWWAKLFYVLVVLCILGVILWFNNRHIRLAHTLEMERENNIRQKELDDERVRFVTNMTHELRTPLTLMLGPLEDLKNNTAIPLPESNRIALIYDSGMKLLTMINRLMDFRKTEMSNRGLCVKRGNIGNFVKEIVTSFKELNRNRALSYRLHIDKSLPDSILFDHDAVETILNNLIANAVKNTPNGSISVDVVPVEKMESSNFPGIRISVADTGAGIPEAALPYIWDRYYQVEDSAHHTSGIGIGLSLVRNLVKLHEGEVSVSSTVGEGTTFRVVIPIRDVWEKALILPEDSAAPVEALVAAEAEEGGGEQDSRTTLLVVEDNEDILGYIRDSFESDYNVVTAVNGNDGLCKAREVMPDIIVSDIMMPEMDGTEMCQALKLDVTTSHIPIILLTAKDSNADRMDGYHKGADSYLTKPFSSAVLRSRIENLLESRRRLALCYSAMSHHVTEKPELSESINRIDAEFLEKVTSIINDNIENENIDVDFIGAQVGMSHSTFYRKIKALTGLTANEFLRKVKMRNAERLLLTQRYTVAEVSYMVGISSVPYFRQCFKEEFGLSPSAYVKQKTGEAGA